MRYPLALVVCCALVSGCFANSDPEPSGGFSLGKPFFQGMRYESVTEFAIAMRDPRRGTSWTAEFVKPDPREKTWEIRSAPEGQALTDRQADSKFLNHLIDTISTLRPVEIAPRGSLASHGLEPAHISLRWKIGPQTFELWLGDETKSGTRPAKVTGSSEVYLAQGAAFEMLTRVESFESLRNRTLSTLDSDDVDEFELKKNGRRTYYAQRHGGGWVDAAKKPLKKDAEAILEQITHWRIKDYLAAETANAGKTAPFEVILKDRRGDALPIRIRPHGGRLIAELASRPGGAFELYPEILRIF